jgi:hypothetical protein
MRASGARLWMMPAQAVPWPNRSSCGPAVSVVRPTVRAPRRPADPRLPRVLRPGPAPRCPLRVEPPPGDPCPDLVGMHHLAELLTHPGQPLPALSLAAGGVAPNEPSRQHLLDGAAKAAYLLRPRELAERLDEAEARHDRASIASLQAELDALVDHVEAATGIAGRPRAFRSPGELARTAVRKAIKRAIDRIGAAEPALADHLRAHVSTGYTCLYTADARRPIRWSTTRRAACLSRPVRAPDRSSCRRRRGRGRGRRDRRGGGRSGSRAGRSRRRS